MKSAHITVADDNHKPEMAIAITPFDGLCGFRPLKEIAHFLSTVPTLRKLVGESEAKQFESEVEDQRDERTNKKALEVAFSALMKNEKSTISAKARELVTSAEEEGENFAGGGGPSNGGKELADLVVRCNSQFEGDIGLFVLFFLNYVKLEVGEAMFLKADDIHAYLSGGKSIAVHSKTCLINSQISLNAWHPQTTWFAQALPLNSKISPPSRLCSPTITLLLPSKR